MSKIILTDTRSYLFTKTWYACSIPAAENITVFLGSIYFREGIQKIGRFKIVHSEWRITPRNDIGLIQIDYVYCSENVMYIALPDISDSYPHYEADIAITSGWGWTDGAGKY